MDRQVSLRRFGSHDDMKADARRFWQSQPPHARLQAVTDLNEELFALKGTPADAQRLQRTVRIVKR